MLTMPITILAGVFVGLVAGALTLPLLVCLECGIVSFVVSLVVHMRYQLTTWERVNKYYKLFP